MLRFALAFLCVFSSGTAFASTVQMYGVSTSSTSNELFFINLSIGAGSFTGTTEGSFVGIESRPQTISSNRDHSELGVGVAIELSTRIWRR
jgi:hypothetical protein